MAPTTPIYATALEALPRTWAIFDAREQSGVALLAAQLVGSGVDRVAAVAKAILDKAPGAVRGHERAFSSDLLDYKRALGLDDNTRLAERAAYASGFAAEAAAEKEAPTYRAEQAADGTWTVFHLPIFSEHDVGKDGKKKSGFGKDWLQGALSRAKVRQAEGYFAPLHVRHHDFQCGEDSEVEAAGKIRLSSLEQIPLGGKPTWTIFADLVGVPPGVYDRLRRGELSYRSIEMLDVSKGEIDSLALLDHDVPFFRYPLLRISEEQPRSLKLQGAGPALAYRASSGPGLAVLFRYDANPLQSLAALAQETTMPRSAFFDGHDDDPDKKKPEEFAGDVPPGAAPAGPAAPAAPAAPDPVLGQIMAVLQQIAAKIGVGAPNGGATPPAQAGAGPVEVGMSGASMGAAGAAQVNALFSSAPTNGTQVSSPLTHEAQGELAGMHAGMAEMRAKVDGMEAQSRVDKFAAGLREKGCHEDLVRSFMDTAKAQGEAAAMSYAAGMLKTFVADPPPSWGNEFPARTADPEEVAAYSEKGPEALAQARRVHATWKRCNSEHSLKDYLAVNLNSESFLADAAGKG